MVKTEGHKLSDGLNVTLLTICYPLSVPLSLLSSLCLSLCPCSTMSSAVDYFVQEKIWFDKPRYDDAERHFYERINSSSHPAQVGRERFF